MHRREGKVEGDLDCQVVENRGLFPQLVAGVGPITMLSLYRPDGFEKRQVPVGSNLRKLRPQSRPRVASLILFLRRDILPPPFEPRASMQDGELGEVDVLKIRRELEKSPRDLGGQLLQPCSKHITGSFAVELLYEWED